MRGYQYCITRVVRDVHGLTHALDGITPDGNAGYVTAWMTGHVDADMRRCTDADMDVPITCFTCVQGIRILENINANATGSETRPLQKLR